MAGKAQIHQVSGATDATTHSYSDEEKVAFADYINNALKKDADCAPKLPININDMSLFTAVHDGILLCKLINDAVPETIDERVINKKNLNTFRITENQTLVVNSARAIGCNVVNIGNQDLIDEKKTHLILGLIWQIVKIGLFSRINLVNHPELYRLLEEGETIEDLLKLPIDQILLRWFNYHLKNAGSPKRVKNFSGDIKDSEAYTILLAQIAPQHCNRDPLKEGDVTKRAELVLQNAAKLDCRKFVTAKDIVKGNPKLNLAFVANLFNTWPALEPVEFKPIEETREEKTFRNWMNSLGVEPFVNNLYEDLRDGLILLQLFEKVQPGIVDQKRVNYNPPNTYKKLENCNYAIELGRKLNFSLVGIQGKDIMDANKTLTLAVVWQLMRFNVLSILNRLGGGQKISDAEIINWANKKNAHKGLKITSFHDPSLKDAIFMITLVDSVRPGSVDFSVIVKSSDPADHLLNAKYAISIARKIGAIVFALPEDIVEVKNKMIMTYIASLMAVDLGAK